MPFFLLGHMGSGKTTLGKKTASILNVPFLDLDELIVLDTGMSIHELFAQKGEVFFRKTERSLLYNYPFQTNTIVATGGGTPCFYDNHAFMKKIGITIYLKVSVDELANRLQLSNERPLLFNNTLNLHDFIIQNLSQRESHYSMSDYIVESDNTTVDDIKNIIQI
tara:strand:+ start:123 stop:617 length:495 start_codon:yes stop_codon:yes gene_type:complete